MEEQAPFWAPKGGTPKGVPEVPGFHTTTREPKRAHLGSRPSKTPDQNSTRRHPERHKKSEMVTGEGKKSEILGGPAEGGPVEGGSGGSWSRSKPATIGSLGVGCNNTQQHTTTHNNNNNNNNNTTTTTKNKKNWPKH